jgi:cation transport ATPase
VDKDDYLYKQLQNHIENRNMKYLVFLLKGILSLPILLFAIATFLGSAYLQTLSLLLILVFIFYWPFFKKKKAVHITTRLLAIFLILSLQFTLFRGAPKASIYLSEEAKQDLHSIYVVKKTIGLMGQRTFIWKPNTGKCTFWLMEMTHYPLF